MLFCLHCCSAPSCCREQLCVRLVNDTVQQPPPLLQSAGSYGPSQVQGYPSSAVAQGRSPPPSIHLANSGIQKGWGHCGGFNLNKSISTTDRFISAQTRSCADCGVSDHAGTVDSIQHLTRRLTLSTVVSRGPAAMQQCSDAAILMPCTLLKKDDHHNNDRIYMFRSTPATGVHRHKHRHTDTCSRARALVISVPQTGLPAQCKP